MKRFVGMTGKNRLLNDDQAREVYRRILAGEDAAKVAGEFGIPEKSAKNIFTGRSYVNATLELRQQRIAKELGD